MNHNDSNAQRSVTAQRVPDGLRLQTLPKHFGVQHLFIENLVFVFAKTLIPTYRGGYWHFYDLSNGGFYMAPESEPARVIVEGNGFDGVLGADALGIVVCLFAFSHGAFALTGQAQERCTQHYGWLRDYSYTHQERYLISAAID